MFSQKQLASKLLPFIFFVLLILFAGCNNEQGLGVILSSATMDLPPILEFNPPPIIECIDCSSLSVCPSEIVNFCVTATDPRGETLTYGFKTQDGLVIANGCTAVWTLPDSEGKYKIRFAVSDGVHTVTDEIEIDVAIHPILHFDS